MHVREQRRPETEPVAGERAHVRAYAVALFAVALSGTAVVATRGGSFVAPGAFCVFALLLALCVNRFAFFPNEIAATSEAAVLVAAVVAFDGGVTSAAPLVLALLVGPLDALHWEQRSFLRMAYNAGNRWLATGVAAAAFAGINSINAATQHSVSARVVAVVVAAVAFALTDSLLTVGLERARGIAVRDAFPQVFEGDALTIPLAAYGAGVGFLAAPVGWWATVLALVPIAFVPELLLARARWSGRAIRDTVLVGLAVALLAAVIAALPVPDVATFAALAAISVLAGVELGVDRRAPIAPLLALVVVAAGLVTTAAQAPFAGAMVAMIGTGTAWSTCWASGRRLPVRACSIGGVAGALAGAVVGALARGPWSSAAGAVVGGLAFEVIVVAVSPARATRRRRFHDAGWAAPLLGAAVGGAVAWRTGGVPGAVLYVAVVSGGFVSVAWWALPPCSSRVLRGAVLRLPSRSHRGVLIAAAVGGWSIGATACAATGVARPTLVWSAVAISEVAIAMALGAVRQWRFAPRRRRREIALLATFSVVVVAAYPSPPLAAHLSGLVVLAACLVGTCVVGARLAPVSDRAAMLVARAEVRS